MGNLLNQSEISYKQKMKEVRLFETIKISQQQQQRIASLIKSRSNIKNQYLCTATGYYVNDPQQLNSTNFCSQFKQMTIFYDDFDSYLVDHKQIFPLKAIDVQLIIMSVSQALNYLIECPLKIRHGDINLSMICKKGNTWKLIDNSFIRQGISAYQKVLLKEDGFISPFQMDKIRYGFVRETPTLKQSDDIFALGMTCLEIMSNRPSRFCYKQTYSQFNQKNIEQRIVLISQTYEPDLVKLVRKMLNFNEQDRIKIKQILQNPLIVKHKKKTSLKPYVPSNVTSTPSNLTANTSMR